MATLGDLVANLGVNTAAWGRGLQWANNKLTWFAGQTGKTFSSIAGGFGQIGGGLVDFLSTLGHVSRGVKALAAVIMGLSFPAQLAAQAETTEIAFTAMLRSAEKAKSLIKDLNDFAAATPFEQPQVLKAGKALLAFGFQAREVIPTLTAIGDVASGVGAPIEEIAHLFGKVRVDAKLMGKELNQFTDHGIPIIAQLAKQFNKPETAIRKMVEESQVSFRDVQKAFAAMSGPAGQFTQLMEKQSKSTTGIFSNMKDQIGYALRDLGTVMIEAFNLKGAMNSIIGFLQAFRSSWLPGITSTLTAVGSVMQTVLGWLGGLWTAWITNNLGYILSWVDTLSAMVLQGATFFADTFLYVWNFVSEVAGLVYDVWMAVFGDITQQLQFLMRNWYTLFQIAYQNVVLFAGNSWKHIQAFFANIGRWLEWLPGNWSKVMFTLADLLMTAFINMAINIKGFFKSLYDFAKGKGFKFEATGLTEGFHNSIDKLPELVTAAVDKSTPELAKLYGQLESDEADFAKKQAARAAAMAPKILEAPTLPTPLTLGDLASRGGDQIGTKNEKKPELKGVEAHTAEAFRAVVQGTNQGPKTAEEKMVSNTALTNKKLDSLLAAMDRTAEAAKKIKLPAPVKLS